MLRFLKHLVGGAVFDDGAVEEDERSVAHVAGEGHFVCDDEHGEAVFDEFFHYVEDFAYAFGVEGACGFVEEEGFGVHGQGSCDGDALLLSAGHFVGVGCGAVGEAYAVEQFFGSFCGFFDGFAFDVYGGFDDVADGCAVGEEVPGLEDHADALPDCEQGAFVFGVAAWMDCFVAYFDFAAVEFFEAVDAA